MINPNQKHSLVGTVTRVDRRKDKSISHLEVDINGQIVESILGLDHNTVIVGDKVNCTIGFRIMSDQYVLENIRRILK